MYELFVIHFNLDFGAKGCSSAWTGSALSAKIFGASFYSDLNLTSFLNGNIASTFNESTSIIAAITAILPAPSSAIFISWILLNQNLNYSSLLNG